jgi:hypothetical protein
MKLSVEMGSSAMMYVPSFIDIGFGFQTLVRPDQEGLIR